MAISVTDAYRSKATGADHQGGAESRLGHRLRALDPNRRLVAAHLVKHMDVRVVVRIVRIVKMALLVDHVQSKSAPQDAASWVAFLWKGNAAEVENG